MSSGVTFEVKGVVEALVAKCAQIAFYVAVILHVTIHETLQLESFLTYFALVLILRIFRDLDGRRKQLGIVVQRLIFGILHAEAAMNQQLEKRE